ncbi:MAG: AbrB/MazE/SpoVT family DNA-binding domain-containing protein [Gammaproteobacteria bacterium]|jgi:antitoxin MazE
MRINLVKIGNSQGVIIPAALLASCELNDGINLQVKGKRLILEALKQPRAGWFDNSQPEAEEAVLDSISAEEGSEDWTW